MLQLQGALVTREGDGLTVVPEKGHAHPFNRLAAALQEVGGATLLLDSEKVGLWSADKNNPPRLYLSPTDVRRGDVTPLTRGKARRCFEDARSALGRRSLWKSRFVRLDTPKTSPPEAAILTGVLEDASTLNQRAAVIRRESRSGNPLSPAGWNAAKALRNTLKLLVRTRLPQIVKAAEFNLKELDNHVPSESFVSTLGTEGVVANTNLSSMQVRLLPGAISLNHEALSTATRETVSTAKQVAEDLMKAGEHLLTLQDPRVLAVRTADYVTAIHSAETSFASADGTLGMAQPRPAAPRALPPPEPQSSLESLRASYDFMLTFLPEASEVVLTQAERLLEAQRIAYVRKGNFFEILPGQDHVLNQQAQELAAQGIGLLYEPTCLELRGINGEFGASPEGCTYKKRVSTSHQSIVEGRIDSTLRHELDHVRVARAYDAGVPSLWSGVMWTVDQKAFDSTKSVGTHYGKAMFLDEVLGNAQSARTLAAEAQALVKKEGPTSARAFELAALAVYRLSLVADLAANTALVSKEIASSSTPVVIRHIGSQGATATAQSERFKITRAVGSVPGTQKDVSSTIKAGLQSLNEEAANISRMANEASQRRDIAEIAALADKLYAQINQGVASIKAPPATL